jgi:hypothetical protein
MDKLDHLGWVVHRAYEIDGYMVGVRTNSEDCGDWLDSVLADYELRGETAEPYYSVWVAEPSDSVGSAYHVLYRESTDLVRTFDPAALAQRLLGELATFRLRRRSDSLFLDACVVERGGATALVPSKIIPYMRQAGRRLERELSLPLEPTVALGADGALRAVGNALDVSDDAPEDLAWRLGVEAPEERGPRVVPATADLVCVFHYDADAPPAIPLTRARTVQLLASQALNLHANGGSHLRALADLVAGSRCYLVQSARPRESLGLLTDLLDGKEPAVAAAGV